MVTGLILLATKFARQGKDEPAAMRLWQALVIGTAQGLAVLPGISRSGATIATGLFCGLTRETAARYSFVLSLPAVMGALLLEVLDAQAPGTAQLPALLAGAFMAAVTGWLALTLLLKVVRRGGLWMFAPYCLLLGAGVLAGRAW
jgi:undecaprenyl-diphosphatase